MLALTDPTTVLARAGMVLGEQGVGVEVLPLAERVLVEVEVDHPDVVVLEQLLEAVLAQLKLVNVRQFERMQATVMALATSPAPCPE